MQHKDASKALPRELRKLTLSQLPLISQYRALVFYGAADGVADLTKGFDFNELKKKYLVLKSIRLVPYTEVAGYIDFATENSGATETWKETIPNNTQINRIFGKYSESCNVIMRFNGMPKCFGQTPGEGYFPVDLQLDNIYYLFPERLVTWDLNVIMNVEKDLLGNTNNPNCQVLIECYLI